MFLGLAVLVILVIIVNGVCPRLLSLLSLHASLGKVIFNLPSPCPSDLYKNVDLNQILDYKIMPEIFALETPQGN